MRAKLLVTRQLNIYPPNSILWVGELCSSTKQKHTWAPTVISAWLERDTGHGTYDGETRCVCILKYNHTRASGFEACFNARVSSYVY